MVMRWGKRARCKRPDVGFRFHEAPRIDESTDTGNRRAVPGTGVEGIGVGVYGLGEDKVLEMDNCNDCTKMYLKPPNWVLKNNYDGNTSCFVYFTRVKATDLKKLYFPTSLQKECRPQWRDGAPGKGNDFPGSPSPLPALGAFSRREGLELGRPRGSPVRSGRQGVHRASLGSEVWDQTLAVRTSGGLTHLPSPCQKSFIVPQFRDAMSVECSGSSGTL